MNNNEGECVWVEDAGVDTDGIYYTECHNSFYIIDGTPQDNNFKYCPYCGKILKEKQK